MDQPAVVLLLLLSVCLHVGGVLTVPLPQSSPLLANEWNPLAAPVFDERLPSGELLPESEQEGYVAGASPTEIVVNQMLKARKNALNSARSSKSTLVVEREECSHSDDERCFDDTCGLFMPRVHSLESSPPCECVVEDIGYRFTACDPETNTRELHYFWKPPANCLNGGNLPPPRTGLPCSMDAGGCAGGFFLELETSKCLPCPPGSFSPHGSRLFDEWDDWPAQFTTFCILGGQRAYTQCRGASGWRLLGDKLDSGELHAEHYLESVLEFRVQLMRAGEVAFQWAVDSEYGYDSVNFYINELRVSSYTGRNRPWRQVTYSLPGPSYYVFRWTYFKDAGKSDGLDRAFLRNIRVDGTALDSIHCAKCPEGFFAAEEGTAECERCPADAHGNAPLGATACISCPDDQYTFEGSDECVPKRVCSARDVGWTLGPCVDGHQERHYEFIEPVACVGQLDLTALQPRTQPCVVCPAGHQTAQSDPGSCVECPRGTANANAGGSCTACAGNQVGVSLRRLYSQWHSWPQGFDSLCTGPCNGNGWRLGGTLVDSGIGHGPNAESALWITVNISEADGVGAVQFDYLLSCSLDQRFAFHVDEELVYEAACSGCVPTEQLLTESPRLSSFTHPLQRGVHTLMWVFASGSAPAVDPDCGRLLLTRVQLTGVEGGGAARCELCAAGYTPAQGEIGGCAPCAPSTFSSAPGEPCVACPLDSFNDVALGIEECVQCGSNTHRPASAQDCQYDCSHLTGLGEHPNPVWDLGPLATRVFGPISEEDSSERFYINLCAKNMTGTTCLQGGTPLETHVCKISTSNSTVLNSGTDVGLLASISSRITSASPLARASSPLFTFTSLESITNPHSATGMQTEVQLICSLEEGIGAPVLQSKSATRLVFTWESLYGCRLCGEEDLDVVKSGCVDGVRTYTSVWNSVCRPWSGVPLPAPVTEPCSDVSVSTLTITVVALFVFMAIVLLVIGLGLLYKRYRRVEHEYSVLRESTGDVPLTAPSSYADEADDEEVDENEHAVDGLDPSVHVQELCASQN
mmetsp:Transcript_34957/g.87965  ORF Transcript_34957/g.87965 Transcript_34957/m.87965 type:complete len:1035 (-) Transcript_34957:99-3203(-)